MGEYPDNLLLNPLHTFLGQLQIFLVISFWRCLADDVKLFQQGAGLVQNQVQFLPYSGKALLVLRVVRQPVRVDFKVELHLVLRVKLLYLCLLRIFLEIHIQGYQVILQEFQGALVLACINLIRLSERNIVVVLYTEVRIATVIHVRVGHRHRVLPFNHHPLIHQRP